MHRLLVFDTITNNLTCFTYCYVREYLTRMRQVTLSPYFEETQFEFCSTNAMHQSPSWEANSRSDSQEGSLSCSQGAATEASSEAG